MMNQSMESKFKSDKLYIILNTFLNYSKVKNIELLRKVQAKHENTWIPL